jgi:hypothetical protein
LAQEIAVREGLKVIVLPSISGVGENYRVAASIRDVASGKNVKTEFVKAHGKDKVLDAVDRLSAAIRKDLGESLQTVSQSKRLSSVTTQSLDALRQYSMATERSLALRWDEAKVYLENALRVDPNFTAARASLGMMHVEQAMNGMPHFDVEEGKRLLSEAVKHVDGLTDREKYGILAFHARAVERNPEHAIGYLKTLIVPRRLRYSREPGPDISSDGARAGGACGVQRSDPDRSEIRSRIRECGGHLPVPDGRRRLGSAGVPENPGT